MWKWIVGFFSKLCTIQVFIVVDIESNCALCFAAPKGMTSNDLIQQLHADYVTQLEIDFDFDDVITVIDKFPKTTQEGNIRSMYARIM